MLHSCRFCHTPIQHTFCDLGLSPLSNAYLSAENLEKKEPLYPLHAYVCAHCLLVQLPSLHTPAEIFEEYAYFSSYSNSWLEHAKTFAEKAQRRFNLDKNSLVIEIASNDGYLLQFFKDQNIPILGIEPAKNVAKVALAKGIPTLTEFFGSRLAKTQMQQADLLIGNNVLAHVPNLNDFIQGLKMILKPNGIISLEFPHLLKLMQKNQFDTIYHEHFSYFSLLCLQKIFAHFDLTIFDVEQLSTHGGSLRLFCTHTCQNISSSVERVIEEEKAFGLDNITTYTNFSTQVNTVKNELLAFFERVQKENKTVMAYGAPAKGNTLLNYCGLNSKVLPSTVDQNTYKQGKFLPGTKIPIFPVEQIKKVRPDYLLVLPWNLKNEIVEQTSYIKEWGGKFVIPIPHLEIVH